jgi:hypothetical protein
MSKGSLARLRTRETKMADRRLSVHTIFTGVYLMAALLTLLPMGTASKPCLLGYMTLCSFSPVSTIGLLALAGLHVFLQRRSVTEAHS